MIFIRWAGLSAAVGVVAGLASALFLYSLELATSVRDSQSYLFYGLPFAGALIGFVYYRFGAQVGRGHNLLLDEIHEPKNILPLSMAPIVFGSSVLSHLAGASVGREGAAIQISSSLADQLSRIFPLSGMERKTLLVAGTGAGFSAAIGAPWAGVIFGMEVLQVGGLKLDAWPQCLLASFIAFFTCRLTGMNHSEYVRPGWPDLNILFFLLLVSSAICFGWAARLFIRLSHLIENFFQKKITRPYWRTAFGGILLLGLFYYIGPRYAGLGLPALQQSFLWPASFSDPLLKGVATALSVGTGFKGGEFIPLVFIGATLGSALAAATGLGVAFFAAIGFSSTFGAASNTPLACALMAGELFGWKIFPFALLSGYLSYYTAGDQSIYRAQRKTGSKFGLLREKFTFFHR